MSVTRSRLVLAVLATVAATLVAALALVRSRALVSAAELEAAQRFFAAERTALASVPRARDGVRAGSSRDLLRELLDEHGPMANCWRLTRDPALEPALDGRFEPPPRTWDWRVPDNPGPPPPGVALQMQAPPYLAGEAPPILAAVEAACAELPARLVAIAAMREGEGPYVPGSFSRSGLVRFPLTIVVAHAATVLARARAERGDVEGALSLLLHAATAIEDVRRGQVDLFVSVVSVDGDVAVFSAFQTLLARDVALDSAAIARLHAQLDARLASLPPTDVPLRTDLAIDFGAMYGLDRETIDLMWVVKAQASRDVQVACTGRTPGDCSRALHSRITGAAVPEDWLVELLGKRTMRGPIVDALLNDYFVEHEHVSRRFEEPPTLLRMAKLQLELLALRSAGTCPDRATIPAERLSIPETGATITFNEVQPDVFELQVATPIRFPSMMFLCPASPGGRWL